MLLLRVKIEIEDTCGKKASLEISESDQLSNLIIISKVFELFGINTDVFEMTKTYKQIGEAYSSFFNQVDPIEQPSTNELETKSIGTRKKLIEGLTKNKEELENTYKSTDDVPEFVKTGIKVREDGAKLYRCFYKCFACYNKGSRYIWEFSRTTFCHRCQHELLVYPAHPEGFPNQDSFGNFFRAGDFKDWNMDWD